MPLIVNEPLSTEPVPATRLKLALSPASGSVADSVPTVVPDGWFSATLDFESAMSVGASFTFVTLTVNAFSNTSPPPSVTRTRIE